MKRFRSIATVLAFTLAACSTNNATDAGDATATTDTRQSVDSAQALDASGSDTASADDTVATDVSATDVSIGSDAGFGAWPDPTNTGPMRAATATHDGVTYADVGTAANPIVHDGDSFTGTVTLSAPAAYHVFRNCRIASTTDYYGIQIQTGVSHITIENCDIGGQFTTVLVDDGASNIVIQRNNLHDCENGITTNGTDVQILDNYVHNDAEGRDWGNAPHWDGIEVYSGSNVIIRHNNLRLDPHTDTSLVNIAPWGGPVVVDGVRIENNLLGGGGYHFTFDNRQSTASNPVRNIVAIGNHHRSVAGYGLANITDGVGYTWMSNVFDCDGSAANVGDWPAPCP